MKKKHIKALVRKQLKNEYPNWQRLTKKEKRAILTKVLHEVVSEYDSESKTEMPLEEMLGIAGQMPTSDIMTLSEMAEFIDSHLSSKIIKMTKYSKKVSHIKNEELSFIDDIIDNTIINRILAYKGYTPCMRKNSLSMLFRAELLKAIKYPEISYRKYCTSEYMGMDRKENKSFIGLPLNRNKMIDHSELSIFRSQMTFSSQINLIVYILYHFYQSGLLSDCVIHGIDSTEIHNECSYPLASIEVNGKKISIYSDPDCDCGKRRNKRDKSVFVVGYRLHTLTAIDAKTGESFPLVSLLAPANHHDSYFLVFLVKLAQSMGVDIKLITADEAYHDKEGELYEQTGTVLTTPPRTTVNPPEHVDVTTQSVFFDGDCYVPMIHVGSEGLEHEYKCGLDCGEQCHRSDICPQYRMISMDQGYFQRIPYNEETVKEANDIRKNCERPFNLLKNQTGLEDIRVRSQGSSIARCTIASIAVLLIQMAGKRVKPKKQEIYQEKLFVVNE